MKGFTHFMSGIAAASFIPQVVRMSATSRLDTVEGASSSFILLLAGLYGILPDSMDFKVGQFFATAKFEVDPDPVNPDPAAMAQVFADAVKFVGETGKTERIQFYPIQLGASLWKQYNVIFEPGEVVVQVNEIVKTSQVPIPGTAPTGVRVGRAKLLFELKSRSDEPDWLNRIVQKMRRAIKGPDPPPGPVKPSTIDIFSGTQFELQRESDGKIYFYWLPWHRTWSHSYVLGLLLSLPIFAAAYLLSLTNWWLYGLVCFLAFAVHITEDMTGHIGGSLLWPLHPPRTEGLELFKASDPRTNFSVDYACTIFILWNMDRFTSRIVPLPGWAFLTLFLVIPLAIYFPAMAWIKKRMQYAERGFVERSLVFEAPDDESMAE